MASNSSTAAGLQQGAIYNCKWGNVTILDRQNYPTFASTCRTTLLAAGVWNIVQGTEAAPANLTTNEKEWVTRRDRALQIMFKSTSKDIRETLDSFIENADAPGLWLHLATYNQATNELFVVKIMNNFHRDSYKPPNDTISAFAARLRKAQKTLAGTSNAISDQQLRLQLMEGLPDTNIWQTAKQFIVNQYPTFEEAFRYLLVVEEVYAKPAEANNANPNAANTNRGNQRGRGSRRGRGRGRGNFRGRGRDQRSGSKPISSNQCAWCLKEGHWQKDCREYKKARDAAHC